MVYIEHLGKNRAALLSMWPTMETIKTLRKLIRLYGLSYRDDVKYA